MPIINIRWTCSNCKSIIDMNEPLPIVHDSELKDIEDAKRIYQEQYKLYSEEKPSLIDKKVQFAVLVNKHNKKFWYNNWEIRELYDKINIRVISETKWYKFGKSCKFIKEFILENEEPYKFENVNCGIVCPICHKITITKYDTIDLSKV